MIARGRPNRLLRRVARRSWTPGRLMGFALGATALTVMGAVLGLLMIAARAHGANVKPGEDTFWKSPAYSQLAPASIALLPAVAFDRSADNERLVSETWAATFSKGSYRWLSATSARTLLTGNPAGDSLQKLARASVLKNARVDSALAIALCGRLRVQAVLSVFVDQWDKQAIEPDQSGKPWARVHLTAAMVDTLGRLLWTGSGSETLEGLTHVPNTPGDARSEALPTPSEFATGEGQPPPFREVLIRLLTRWSTAFPQRPATQ